MVKAREELAAGDLEQASEKAWGAASLMVKAVAEQRAIPHVSHKGLWHIVSALRQEIGDRDISRLFHVANDLHKNFYEDLMDVSVVEEGISDVERFVERVEPLV